MNEFQKKTLREINNALDPIKIDWKLPTSNKEYVSGLTSIVYNYKHVNVIQNFRGSIVSSINCKSVIKIDPLGKILNCSLFCHDEISTEEAIKILKKNLKFGVFQ